MQIKNKGSKGTNMNQIQNNLLLQTYFGKKSPFTLDINQIPFAGLLIEMNSVCKQCIRVLKSGVCGRGGGCND